MNVSLTPALEQFVRNLSESGAYNNASEVVRDALRLLMRVETRRALELQRLQAAIAHGDADLANGEVVELSTDVELGRHFADLLA